jgi:hypothetical protein
VTELIPFARRPVPRWCRPAITPDITNMKTTRAGRIRLAIATFWRLNMARSKPIVNPPASSDNGDAGALDFNFGANVPERNDKEPVNAEAVPEPPDPFNPAALRLPQNPTEALDPFDPRTYRMKSPLVAAAGVKKHITELQVCKPNKAWWVRIHPDPEYQLATWVVELKDEGESYLVLPHLWSSLFGEATFQYLVLHLAINRQNKIFIWPVRRPADESEQPNRWMRTPLEASAKARKQWTRIAWNMETRQHEVFTSEMVEEPDWPDLPFRDLIEIAFKDHVIDSLDHPVLRRLRGET